jgi:CheY-like chemotaxis protein
MKKRILIVEDNAVAAKAEKFTLLKIDRDCEVECVLTGEESTEITSKNKYDLILMDLGLPGIDGIQAMEKIRSAGTEINNSLTPIVTVTANENADEHARCLKAGANEVICKPFTAEKAKAVLFRFCLPG